MHCYSETTVTYTSLIVINYRWGLWEGSPVHSMYVGSFCLVGGEVIAMTLSREVAA